MSTPRAVAFAFTPTLADEAKGVTIRRSIGGERLAILDPFMLLDHASIAPSENSETVGFPRHPHRGIETLSYVLNGRVGHKDSIGNAGEVGPGGTQWMTAGNGIYHEEMLLPEENGADMLQLWFSLPQSKKRIPPGYKGVPGDQVPVISSGDASVRIVAGQFEGTPGAFTEIAVQPTILDIQIESSGGLSFATPPNDAAFLYLVSGSVEIESRKLSGTQMIVLSKGDQLSIKTEGGARLLYVGARPLDEPIIQYRSFVMNTVEDIHETIAMMEAGTFANG